ncbi:MAG TPA: hypothetical protein DC013_06035 [Ruminococcaceae bacterium]|jgi:hypothetical protein|nr:hypothetical protein [Oscillospiraceae bacterium]
MNRETVKIVGRIIGVLVAVLLLTNPPRSKFNNAVFEGGTPNSITSDQQKMNQIIEVNREAYHDENAPRVKRRNYFLYSVYEVKINEQETFQILGILGIFRLVHW